MMCSWLSLWCGSIAIKTKCKRAAGVCTYVCMYVCVCVCVCVCVFGYVLVCLVDEWIGSFYDRRAYTEQWFTSAAEDLLGGSYNHIRKEYLQVRPLSFFFCVV